MTDLRASLVDPARFGRFASVGLLGATVDLTVSSALVLGPSVAPELAKFIGAECAIILMFLINDRWTFAESETQGWGHRVRRLIKSNVVRSGGIAIQIIVVFVLTRISISVMVAGTDIWPVLTMPIAIACAFLVNYIGESLFTWRIHH